MMYQKDTQTYYALDHMQKSGTSQCWYISSINGLYGSISVRQCVGEHAFQCVCRCVRGAAAFPYVVHAWLVYCDTAEPRAGLNI